MLKISGKLTFREICPIMTSLRVFGFKNRNFAGFPSDIEILKPFFDRGGQGCRIISVFDGFCANMPEKGRYVGDTATHRSVLEHNSQQ
jgi:hypothetical protein